ncbi:mCG1030839, partial [Mus musculus]
FLLCFFFCFKCLSVSVAGRSSSQWLQCKFPLSLGKCTTLFRGVWGEWEEVGTVWWGWLLFIFLNSFPGDGIFFLK